jgi:hypothetical protein
MPEFSLTQWLRQPRTHADVAAAKRIAVICGFNACIPDHLSSAKRHGKLQRHAFGRAGAEWRNAGCAADLSGCSVTS